MTIAPLNPLEELDFPTPELIEVWEPSAQDIVDWYAYFDAERTHNLAVATWLHDEKSWLVNEVSRLSMQLMDDQLISGYPSSLFGTERCYCSPSRGMLMGSSFDPYIHPHHDTSSLRAQVIQLKGEIAAVEEYNQRRRQSFIEAQSFVAAYQHEVATTAPTTALTRRWWSFR